MVESAKLPYVCRHQLHLRLEHLHQIPLAFQPPSPLKLVEHWLGERALWVPLFGLPLASLPWLKGESEELR